MDHRSLTTEDLIAECANTNKRGAWAEFVRRFQPLITSVVARTARRCGLDRALVADLVQETYLKLAGEEWKRLREFQKDREGSFYGLMKAVARNVTLDYVKTQQTSKRGGGRQAEADFDLAMQTFARQTAPENQVLIREITEKVAQIAEDPTDRRIFLLYYRQGFTTKAISEIPNIQLSQKAVESRLYRLTQQLQRELAKPAKK